jgi:branched-chain amino acid aminotransferase
MLVFLDDRFIDEADAKISIDDRGLLFGDAVFETALLHNGGFFRLQEHLERFANSAAILHLSHPPLQQIATIVRTLKRDNELEHGNVRITLTRGVRDPNLIVTLKPIDAKWVEKARRGWSIVTAKTRRPSTAAVPPELKAIGRTYALLARQEAIDARADDALLLTDDGVVCEGPSWNIFWRIGDTLFTPAIAVGVLPGLTRTVVREVAPGAGFRFEDGMFPRSDLDAADEVFATMTSVGIVSVRRLDGRTLPAATPAADALQPLYWRIVDAECDADREASGSP